MDLSLVILDFGFIISGVPGCFSAGFPVSMPWLSILDVGFWVYYFRGSLDVFLQGFLYQCLHRYLMLGLHGFTISGGSLDVFLGVPVSMPWLSILDVGLTWLYYFRGSLDVFFRGFLYQCLDYRFLMLGWHGFTISRVPWMFFCRVSCINAFIIDTWCWVYMALLFPGVPWMFFSGFDQCLDYWFLLLGLHGSTISGGSLDVFLQGFLHQCLHYRYLMLGLHGFTISGVSWMFARNFHRAVLSPRLGGGGCPRPVGLPFSGHPGHGVWRGNPSS